MDPIFPPLEKFSVCIPGWSSFLQAVVLRDAIAATWKKHSEVAMVQKMKLKSHSKYEVVG